MLCVCLKRHWFGLAGGLAAIQLIRQIRNQQVERGLTKKNIISKKRNFMLYLFYFKLL